MFVCFYFLLFLFCLFLFSNENLLQPEDIKNVGFRVILDNYDSKCLHWTERGNAVFLCVCVYGLARAHKHPVAPKVQRPPWGPIHLKGLLLHSLIEFLGCYGYNNKQKKKE
uniref:Uncharacterized protein n=1 Tax=Anguilla anguilla TaxID=7936 RepID=A0A0E9Q7J3_ANGAN